MTRIFDNTPYGDCALRIGIVRRNGIPKVTLCYTPDQELERLIYEGALVARLRRALGTTTRRKAKPTE